MSYYIDEIYVDCDESTLLLSAKGNFDPPFLYVRIYSSNYFKKINRAQKGKYINSSGFISGQGVYYELFGPDYFYLGVFSGTPKCKCSPPLIVKGTAKCSNGVLYLEASSLSEDVRKALLASKEFYADVIRYSTDYVDFATQDVSGSYSKEYLTDLNLGYNFFVWGNLSYMYCDTQFLSGLYLKFSIGLYDPYGCKIVEIIALSESSLKVDLTYDCKNGIQYTNNPLSKHSLPPVGTKLANGNYKWKIEKKSTEPYKCEERCYEAELTVNCLTTDKPRIDPNSGCTCCLVLDKDVIITPFPDQCSVKVENKSQKTIRVDLLVYPSINHTCSGKGSLRKQISLIPNTSIVWAYDVTFDSKIFVGYDECFLQKCLPPCSNNLAPVKNYITSVEARKVKISGQEYLVIDNNDKYNGDVTIELPFLKPNSKLSIPKGQSIALTVDEIPTQTQIITTSRTWEGVKVEKTVSIPVSFDTETIKTVVTF